MKDDELTPTEAFTAPPDLTPPARVLTPSGARKVAPSPTAPNLSRFPELEQARQESAEHYDALEKATEELNAIVTELEDGRVQAEIFANDSIEREFAHFVLKEGK